MTIIHKQLDFAGLFTVGQPCRSGRCLVKIMKYNEKNRGQEASLKSSKGCYRGSRSALNRGARA